jgi:hypothetical protein
MATASMGDVAGWAYDAGLRNPGKLAAAVAIATAESGRNPAKKGDVGLQNSTWGPSVGLWQIRSLKAEKGKGTIRDEEKLTDPAFNARSMVAISKSGSDWSPWSVTHVTDPLGLARYTAALPLASNAVTAMLLTKGVSGGVSAVSGGASAVGDVAQAVTDPVSELAGVITDAAQTPARIANWLTQPGTWTRILYLVVGGAFLVSGVTLVARPAVGGIMSAVTPVGKAAKMLKGGS